VPFPKKERIKTEFTSLMEDKCEEYDQICTDGLLKDGKVGFAIVTNKQIIKKRRIGISNLQCRTASDHNGNRKYTRTNKPTIIATDSLSSLLAVLAAS
jgi:hypothetical protein